MVFVFHRDHWEDSNPDVFSRLRLDTERLEEGLILADVSGTISKAATDPDPAPSAANHGSAQPFSP